MYDLFLIYRQHFESLAGSRMVQDKYISDDNLPLIPEEFINRRFVCLFAFNNISVISWWSVSLVGETGRPGKNH
jgi:hypothetical protein